MRKTSTSCIAVESSYRKSSSLLWTYTEETSKPPRSTSSEEFKLEKITRPKKEVLGSRSREGWGELCSRTAHISEDAGSRVRYQPAGKVK
ncbi:hypothetical protein RB195_006910 [Necator americanus]|uniref:Uncharacterized protein n=1 Tax=Necator americanus TaxID=51031 RepID=A0ABR1BUS4_NECAM